MKECNYLNNKKGAVSEILMIYLNIIEELSLIPCFYKI